MKKLALLLIVGFISIASFGQRYAYVDTEYILQNVPEYADAQDILDQLAQQWQKDIEAQYQEIDRLYKRYQAEASLLPDDLRTSREEEIINKEKAVKKLQNDKFGNEGELFNKRIELIQPLQEKIFSIIESISKTRNLDFVFDMAGGVSILYANPQLDISDEVLGEMGTLVNTDR